MVEKSLFSIIVPCYNVAPFVAETIRSVIAQTYQNWELILMDDGSKDNTVEVIQPFLEDTRIQLHIQENQGVSVARNNATALAQGDLIAFIDGDDLLIPEALHRYLEIFQKYPDVGVCGSGYSRIDADGQAIAGGVFGGQDFYGWAAVPFITRKLLLCVTGVIRKSVCEQLKSEQGFLFDESIPSLAEDFDFWLRCSALTPFYKISDPLFLYRRREGSATSVILLKRQDTIFNVIVPRFLNLYGGSKYVKRKHIRQMASFFYHERGSNVTSWSAKTYWFFRSLLCDFRNRDAWGAFGNQILPKPIYRWIVKMMKR